MKCLVTMRAWPACESYHHPVIDPECTGRLATRTSDAVFAWRQRGITGGQALAVVGLEFLRALFSERPPEAWLRPGRGSRP